MCFLSVAGVFLALALSGRHRRHEAGRAAEMLRSMLPSDVRFQRVMVSCGTNGRVYLHGSVASDENLRVLRTLVEQGHLPSQPVISVQVDFHTPHM